MLVVARSNSARTAESAELILVDELDIDAQLFAGPHEALDRHQVGGRHVFIAVEQDARSTVAFVVIGLPPDLARSEKRPARRRSCPAGHLPADERSRGHVGQLPAMLAVAKRDLHDGQRVLFKQLARQLQ